MINLFIEVIFIDASFQQKLHFSPSRVVRARVFKKGVTSLTGDTFICKMFGERSGQLKYPFFQACAQWDEVRKDGTAAKKKNWPFCIFAYTTRYKHFDIIYTSRTCHWEVLISPSSMKPDIFSLAHIPDFYNVADTVIILHLRLLSDKSVQTNGF